MSFSSIHCPPPINIDLTSSAQSFRAFAGKCGGALKNLGKKVIFVELHQYRHAQSAWKEGNKAEAIGFGAWLVADLVMLVAIATLSATGVGIAGSVGALLVLLSIKISEISILSYAIGIKIYFNCPSSHCKE